MRRSITLADVAAEAGVHAATVSRALSRPDLVNRTTRDRVEQAAERLGYVPNRAARQLAGGSTAALAVLVPDVANPYFAAVVQAAQRHAAAVGTLVLLVDTAGRAATEIDALRSLAPSIDGALACSPSAPTGRLREAAGGRPVVLVNRRARGLASVVVDQAAVATLAVDHLRALGHHRIGVVRGPASYWSSAQRARALAGPGLVGLGPVEPTFAGGATALAHLLARPGRARVTAVAAFNDVQALGLLAAAADAGLAVPGDLSVTGSDGVPLAAMATPSLTTVAAPLDALGAAAVDAVRALAAGEAVTTRTLAPHLVVGASTRPP